MSSLLGLVSIGGKCYFFDPKFTKGYNAQILYLPKLFLNGSPMSAPPDIYIEMRLFLRILIDILISCEFLNILNLMTYFYWIFILH